MHLDLLEVKLDEAIEAEVTIELLGAEEAPGVKEGGVLEHVTHEITISALPTEIPESIPADVSGMEIGDTLQLSALIAARGRRVRRSARTSTPRRSRSPPSPAARRGGARARARGGGRAGRRGRRADRGEAPEGEEAAEGDAEGGDAGDSGGDSGDEE